MHLFEYLLRDFINVERFCRPDSIVVMHDCVPHDPYIALRRPDDPRRALSSTASWWAGDVWKIVPALRKYRPDLRIYVFDAFPTGLVCVTGLCPGNDTLSANYAKIVGELVDHDLETYGMSQFRAECQLMSTSEIESHDRASRLFVF